MLWIVSYLSSLFAATAVEVEEDRRVPIEECIPDRGRLPRRRCRRGVVMPHRKEDRSAEIRHHQCGVGDHRGELDGTDRFH